MYACIQDKNGDVLVHRNIRTCPKVFLKTIRPYQEDIGSVEDLENFIVNPEGERPIPLAAVAEINIKKSPGEIRRLNHCFILL